KISCSSNLNSELESCNSTLVSSTNNLRLATGKRAFLPELRVVMTDKAGGSGMGGTSTPAGALGCCWRVDPGFCAGVAFAVERDPVERDPVERDPVERDPVCWDALVRDPVDPTPGEGASVARADAGRGAAFTSLASDAWVAMGLSRSASAESATPMRVGNL